MNENEINFETLVAFFFFVFCSHIGFFQKSKFFNAILLHFTYFQSLNHFQSSNQLFFHFFPFFSIFIFLNKNRCILTTTPCFFTKNQLSQVIRNHDSIANRIMALDGPSARPQSRKVQPFKKGPNPVSLFEVSIKELIKS